MIGFLFGAIAGATAAYVYRDRIATYLNDKAPSVRDQAAERLEAFGRGAENVLDRAKTRIGSTVRAGGERLRAVGGTSHTPE
jgi:hypothetical protein